MVLEFFRKKNYVLDVCDVLDTLSIWDHLELFEVKYHLYAFLDHVDLWDLSELL